MEHRLATSSDLDRIMEIIADAQCFLKENGVDQWQNGYPTRESYEQDISESACHVFIVESKIAGVISIFFETEESYNLVEDGSWLTGDAPYAVFHRAAVSRDYRGMGIAGIMLSYAENMAIEHSITSLRGDTHHDNKAMRGLLEKRGFVHCGTIYIDGVISEQTKRVCYEKLLEF